MSYKMDKTHKHEKELHLIIINSFFNAGFCANQFARWH